MKVLRQINKSREGNDCWIDETYTLCEWCEIYYIIHHWKVTGWSSDERVEIVNEPTRSKEVVDKQWKCLIKNHL